MQIRTAALALAAAAGMSQAQSFASTSLDASAELSIDTNLAADISASVDAGFFTLSGTFNFLFDDFDIPASDPILVTGSGTSQVAYDGSNLAIEALSLEIDDVTLDPISDTTTSSSTSLASTITLTASIDNFTAQNTTVTLVSPTGSFPIDPMTGLVNPLGVEFAISTEVFFGISFAVDGSGLVPGIIGGLVGELPLVVSFDNSALTGDIAVPVSINTSTVIDENLVLTAVEEGDELCVSAFFPFDETVLDIDALLFEAFGVTTPITFADVQTILSALLAHGPIDQATFDEIQAQLATITDLAEIDFAIDPAINDLVADFSFSAKYDLTNPISAACNAADIDGDGDNDVFDALAFISAYDPAVPSPDADIDGDGDNDVFDALAFISAYNPMDPACN